MEIKNCPFCGGRGHLDFSDGSNKPYINERKELVSTPMLYHVFCGNCLAKSMDFEIAENAIVAWNRRRDNNLCDRDKCKGCERFGWVCDYKKEVHGFFTCRLQNKKYADTHVTADLITPRHFFESKTILHEDDE